MVALHRRFCRAFSTLFVVGALVVSGCDKPMPPADMGSPPDLTTTDVDLATNPPDLATNPPDLATNPPDLAMNPPDLAMPPPDLAMPPGDMAMTPPDMTMVPGDMAMTPADMSGMPVDMTMPPVDMTMTMPDMTMPRDMAGPADMTMTMPDMTMPRDMAGPADMATTSGKIGDTCTDDSACKEGTSPSCWKMNVLNNTSNPPTPGGYCSSKCTMDTECGSNGVCVNLGPGGFCLSKCNNATTCRHPGYACAFFDTAGVCFSDTIFNCDPKASMGACTESGTMKAGGCLRQAFENKGTCSASCNVGPMTCSALGMTKRQCVYLDTTKNSFMDAWKGGICLESPAMPTMPGGSCMFADECTDGYQCDGASLTCKQLCVKGGMPSCTMGMCADAFMTPATGPGICR